MFYVYLFHHNRYIFLSLIGFEPIFIDYQSISLPLRYKLFLIVLYILMSYVFLCLIYYYVLYILMSYMCLMCYMCLINEYLYLFI